MLNPAEEKQRGISRAKIHFLCAAAVLLVFALVWSVDSAIAYILFGFSCFFICLGLVTWPWQTKSERQYSNRSTSAQPTSPTGSSSVTSTPSFDSLLKDILSKSKKEEQKARPVQGESEYRPVRSAKMITVVLVFIFCIFLIIFFAVVFDDAEATDQSGNFDYLQQASYYYDNNMLDSAYANYRYALKQNPDNTDALFGLANTYSAMGQPDSAILFYDRVLALNGTLVGAAYNKGWVEYKRKNYTKAAELLKSLVEKNPEYLDARQLLGDIYYEQGMQEEALRWYESAYEKGQRNHWITYVMGYLHQTRGNTQRAIDLYKESLSYDSSEIDIYKRLGELIPGKEGEYFRGVAKGEQQW